MKHRPDCGVHSGADCTSATLPPEPSTTLPSPPPTWLMMVIIFGSMTMGVILPLLRVRNGGWIVVGVVLTLSAIFYWPHRR